MKSWFWQGAFLWLGLATLVALFTFGVQQL